MTPASDGRPVKRQSWRVRWRRILELHKVRSGSISWSLPLLSADGGTGVMGVGCRFPGLSSLPPACPGPGRPAPPWAGSGTTALSRSCRPGRRPAVDAPPLVGSQVGSQCRPTSGQIEPIRAFDSLALPGTQTQLDTSADARNLVHIEGVRSSNPLSSTEISQVRRLVRFLALGWKPLWSQVVDLLYGWGFAPWLRRRRYLLRPPGPTAGTAPFSRPVPGAGAGWSRWVSTRTGSGSAGRSPSGRFAIAMVAGRPRPPVDPVIRTVPELISLIAVHHATAGALVRSGDQCRGYAFTSPARRRLRRACRWGRPCRSWPSGRCSRR